MTLDVKGHGAGRLWLVYTLVLLGFIGVGRLAMEAWLVRTAPQELPEFGARTDKAAPFLMAIIDGLREDAAWATDDAPMPWLQSFADRGAWGTAIAGEPTLTAPCVRALLTGRRPDLLTGFRNFNARPVQGSIIGYLHDRGAITAHGGDAAAFQFCINHYPTERVLEFPDQGPTDQGQCDAESVPHVLAQIADGATCITMHLTGPDHAGHKHGATGRPYWEACRTVDGQLQQVVEAFQAKHPAGTVLIASDHGVSAMGTHGGGEASAKRAPFAYVGPWVARIHVPSVHPDHRLDQCALAPTVCAQLGLPQPPLADAPPALQLLELPAAIEADAMDAYVRARLAVARELHGDAVDVIEKRRAQQSAAEFARSLNLFLLPNNAGHASGALLLAALWLVLSVALISRRAVPSSWSVVLVATGLAGLTLLLFNPVPKLFVVSAPIAGLLVLLGCAAAVAVARVRPLMGWGITLACLTAMPILTGAGITLQETFTRLNAGSDPAMRFGLSLITVGLLGALFFRPRTLRLGALIQESPGLIAGFGGVIVGFTLTLRPFIDPHVHLMILYAIAGCAVVWRMLLSQSARLRPGWERLGLAGIALVLFVGTRISEGVAGEVWVNVTPARDLLWLLLGTVIVVGLLAVTLAGIAFRRNLVGLGLAALALTLAGVVRADAQAFWSTAVSVSDGWHGAFPGLPALHPAYVAMALRNGPAFIALGWTLRGGTPDGRLAVRLVAGVALARQLSVMDAEFAVFALVAIGAALCARFTLPLRRTNLAWLAVGVLALRTAIFHAMGFEESFSTLDVGQAFAGMEATETAARDAAGGTVVTGQMMVAGLQLTLRMALPWILLVAALARAAERSEGGVASLRCVLADLAVSYAARGAAIAVALWAWWRNSWWMTHAYTVYAYAAADVILLLVCAALCGAFARDRQLRRSALPAKMPAWSG